MRHYLSFLSALTLSLFALFSYSERAAAQSIDFTRGEDVTGKIADSLKYILPEFSHGLLSYRDGSKSQGLFNVATYNQSIHFKKRDGTIMELAGIDEVERLIADKRVFIRDNSTFYELLEERERVAIALSRELKFMEADKPGAYGTASPTASVTSYTSIEYNGESHSIGINLSAKYRYKETLWLYNGKSLIKPSKKNLIKLLPGRREEIELYCKENGTEFGNYQWLRKLFNSLK